VKRSRVKNHGHFSIRGNPHTPKTKPEMSDFKVTELDENIDFGNLPYWDVVIVGAGPAGLTASLTTAHRGLTTLVIEAKDQAGGQPQFLYADKKIVDVPGFPDGIRGDDLSARVYRQAVDALVQFRFNEELVAIDDTDQVEKDDLLKRVVTKRDSYLCRKVIIACGLLHFARKLPVLDALDSKKVFYKVPKIGDYDGQRVAVVGGGDSALDAAIMALERHAAVDVLCREETPIGKSDSVGRVESSGGTMRCAIEITSAEFQGDAIALTLSDSSQLVVDYVIVQIGFLSAKETFQRLDLRLNEDSSIAIDPYFETSRRGIFAVGDVHGDIKLITVAWAEGIQAAIYAFKEITSPYWLNEKRLRDQKIAMIGEKITQAARGRGK
jgi:ferredoxin/flavodoxin---NADP+ reductase